MTFRIYRFCDAHGVQNIGEIPFDPVVGMVIANGKTLIEENSTTPASIALIQIWEKLSSKLVSSEETQ